MAAEILMLALIAPFVGSFLGLVVDRLPAGRSIVLSRSTCDVCGTVLRWSDLVPILSWLARRGRCRCGEAGLRTFHPLIELAALGVVLWAASEVAGWLLLASALLGWTLLALAVIDHRHLYLPDQLTLPLLPAGLAVIALIEPGRLGAHAVGLAFGWLAFAGIALGYRRLRGREGLGEGDAKLLGAAGAWLGWQALPSVVVIGAAVALSATLARVALGGKLDGAGQIPFGPHLALGFWMVWLYGPFVFG